MPTLSLITAAYRVGASFLAETIASLVPQELPTGWTLEWLVQEDGVDPVLEKEFDSVPSVLYEANRRQFGPAVTRNLALSRATGQLVGVLDQDDVLLPGALARLISRTQQTTNTYRSREGKVLVLQRLHALRNHGPAAQPLQRDSISMLELAPDEKLPSGWWRHQP